MRLTRLVGELLALILFASLLPAASAVAAPSSEGFVPGELIVGLPPGNARASEAGLVAAGVRPLRSIPQLGLAIVATGSAGSESTAAATLEASGVVEWAEPNYIFELDFQPNDPQYVPKQVAYLDRIEASAGWGIARGARQVVIAVLDTGVDTGHEDLRDAIWTNPGEQAGNMIDDDGNGFVDDVNGWDFADDDNTVFDDYGHGTHVAGIAAAMLDNGKGIAGLAGGATILPVDVFRGGIGTYEDLIRAIVYATDNGANIINMSLGATSYSRGEEMAVNYASEKGVVLVAAAGNQGRESFHYPAAHDNVIAVAATTSSDSIAGYSNRGAFVDVAAPGSAIFSSLPGNRYGAMSGTSMATPHVAGLAALVLSRNPSLAPAKLRKLIEENADDLGTSGYDIVFGHGRINARRTLEQTPEGTGAPRPPLPPLDLDLPGCSEMLTNGDFENGLQGWQASGNVRGTGSPAYAGSGSAAFPGGIGAAGSLSQTVSLPSQATAAVLWFAYRIETQDYGPGSSPEHPYDDELNVRFETSVGQQVVRLLETGNTSDTVSAGLEWDQYIYRFEDATLEELKSQGNLALAFSAQNDADTAPTSFWIDTVRLCVKSPMTRFYLPLYIQTETVNPLP